MEDYLLLNTFLNFEFIGEKISVVRTQKGLFAFADKCPHNGTSLSKGYCTKNNDIICSFHKYAFNLETGKCNSVKALTLKTYPIKINEDGVFVGVKTG